VAAKNLRAWSQAERKRRATVRSTATSAAPTLADAVNGVTRRSSTLLRRATSKRGHRSDPASARSIDSTRSNSGLYPIDAAIELDDTSKRKSPVPSPGSVEVLEARYDQVSSPTQSSPPPMETPTERAIKTGSRFVEDLDTQLVPTRSIDLSRPPSTTPSFFSSILSPGAKPRLHISTDAQSVRSSYSGLDSSGTLDMTPSHSYFDLAPSSSSRDLIGAAAAQSDRAPVHQGARPYKRSSDETVREGSPVDGEGEYRPPARRKVGWLEFVFCMVRSLLPHRLKLTRAQCCMEEDNQEQGGQTGPELLYYRD
jgi:hypothetical protein